MKVPLAALALCFAVAGRGEVSHLAPFFPSLFGILRGESEKTLKEEQKKFWDNTVMLVVPGIGKCSGLVIGDCVVTAAHCVGEGKDHHVFLGEEPVNFENIPETLGKSRRIAVTGSKDDNADIAVVKLSSINPAGVGLGRDILPKARLQDRSERDGPLPADIYGYGGDEVKLVEVVGENGKRDYKIEGDNAGKKRHGVTDFVGLDSVGVRAKIRVKGSTSPKRPRAAPLPGDSGGPLVLGGKFHGVASRTGMSLKVAKGATTQEVTGRYIPIANHGIWLEETLNKFRCDKTFDETTPAEVIDEEIVQTVKYNVEGADKTETRDRALGLADGQLAYLKTLLRLKAKAAGVKLPEEANLVASIDFVEKDGFFEPGKIRLMLGDKTTRSRVASFVVSTSGEASPVQVSAGSGG